MSYPSADAFFKDPRIGEAKELLLSALRDAKNNIKEVKPKEATLADSYEKMLKGFEVARGFPLYYPYVGSGLGNGPLVELLDGSIKYDFIGGIGPYYLGHSHEGLIEASIEGALTNTPMQGNLQQNHPSLELMETLMNSAAMDHCFLSGSGAMASENSLKIAFQHKKNANRILAFDNCFMGRTLALSQITDKPGFRVGLPTTLPVDYIPFFNPDDPEKSIETSNAILKKNIQRYPTHHGAMVFELIQGEGGFNIGSHKFFTTLMSTLKEHGIPIIADEIQTFGRTHKLFAFQHFELQEFVDIVSVGKLSLVCATLFKERVKPSPGLLSQTFTACSATIQAALYTLNTLLHSDFYGEKGKNARTFNTCTELLKGILQRHPESVKGPFGVGSMFAFSVFDGNPEKTGQFAKLLFEEGVITFVAGTSLQKIRMLLPVPVLKEADLHNAFNLIEKALEKAKK